MRKVPESVEEVLLDYLDGNLNKAEQEKIEKSLRDNPVWRARYDELRLLNVVLTETKSEEPSKNFTTSVMRRLDQYQAPRIFSLWNSILLLSGVLVAIGITTVLLAGGIYDNTTTSIDLNQIEIPNELVKTPLPSFQFSGKLIVNVIIVLNLVIGWIVLDRAILKPLFLRRMQTGH